MSRKQFTDRQGRTWRPDPTGRFAFRVIDGERWTAEVCMVRGQAPGHDPEGEALLADDVGRAPAPDDPGSHAVAVAGGGEPAAGGPDRPSVAVATPTGPTASAAWSHRVVTTSLAGLEGWLDEQGRAGWELVSLLPRAATEDELVAVLKRPSSG